MRLPNRHVTTRATGGARHPGCGGPGIAARGVTFIEVVFAIATLALMTATLMSGINFIHARQRVEQQRLGAAELANRLVLTFLDRNAYLNPDGEMPSQSRPIAYNETLYRWEMEMQDVHLNETDAVEEAIEDGRQSPIARDRFRQVTIRVWLSEHGGGVRRYGQRDAGTPRASLVRIFDPTLGIQRNPDAADRLMDDPQQRIQFIQGVLGDG